MTKRWPIGCHISIRNGYLAAAKQARQIDVGAFQYFPKNPRSLTVKKFDVQDAIAAAQYCQEHGIVSVAHAPYPTNLAVDRLRDDVDRSLLNDLTIAEACGSIGVVVHFGHQSHFSKGGPRGESALTPYMNIVERLNRILAIWDGQAKLLIENESGQHGTMGTTLLELAQIREMCDYPHKIAFCFDTCHAYASGMWLGEGGYHRENEEKRGSVAGEVKADETWEKEARKVGFLQHVEVIHLNDSQFPAHSRRDRHANIGKGTIGLQRFRSLLTVPELHHIPLILETPVESEQGQRDELLEVTRFVHSL